MLNITELKKIGIGIVVEDKKNDSNIVNVIPLELMTLANGEITSNIDTINSIIRDGKDNNNNSSINVGAYIKAEWIRGANANRLTSPDVRIGERLQLYQYSGLHKFYWETLHGDFDTRDTEHVVYLYVADKNKGEKEIDDEINGYTVTISTRDNYLEINTTKSNNEQYAYNVKIDCKQGKFHLKDDVNNIIYLDSSQNDITLKNGDDSKFSLQKKDINVYCLENINIKCKNYNLEAENKNEEVKIVTETNDTLSVTATTAEIKGGTLDIKSPTGLSGGVTGDTSFGGNIESSSGTLSVKEVSVTDNITAGGNINGANWP